MGQPRQIESSEEEAPVTPKRHRPASELRFTEPTSPPLPMGSLTDALRAALWEVVHDFLFAAHEDFDPWTSGVTGRPAVRRVWTSPPLSGDIARIPEDVTELVEGWFSLVEASDVFEFIESVHENLEVPNQHKFANACNVVLERASSDRRFVMRRLVPIASRSDIATIEDAITACKSAGLTTSEEVLLGALARLASKPEPDARGAVQEAVRSVEEAAFALTGKRRLGLGEALQDLREKGVVDPALESAHRELFAYATREAIKPTSDDARLILVMCAGFVSHLARRAKPDSVA
jgi:hypothetical protein